jgi:hypothetical protein
MRVTLLALILVALAPPLRAGETRTTATTTYQVPYRLTSTNHVLVRVKINGKGPYHFILDTGAPALFVSTAVCRKLGIQPDKRGWGTFERFAIEGGVVLPNVKGRIEDPFQLEGMNGLGLAGVELHGIIGYTVLARFRLGFDFTKDKMSWTPLAFEPPTPEGLDGKAMPEMDALGSILKLVGTMLGKKPEPDVALRGFLGVGLEEGENTVLVKQVLPGGPAAHAGLRAGDCIRRFQGKPVQSVADVQRLATKLAADQTATVTITRDGETQTLRIKIGRGL